MGLDVTLPPKNSTSGDSSDVGANGRPLFLCETKTYVQFAIADRSKTDGTGSSSERPPHLEQPGVAVKKKGGRRRRKTKPSGGNLKHSA